MYRRGNGQISRAHLEVPTASTRRFDSYEHVGTNTEKILRSAKPADLSVSGGCSDGSVTRAVQELLARTLRIDVLVKYTAKVLEAMQSAK